MENRRRIGNTLREACQNRALDGRIESPADAEEASGDRAPCIKERELLVMDIATIPSDETHDIIP
jgi:hypothetical protein